MNEPMQNHSTILYDDDLIDVRMKKLAAICVESVQSSFREVLDYTAQSIALLDSIILRGWGDVQRLDATVEQVMSTFAAYFGETVLRNSEGGMWVEEQKPGVKGTVCIVYAAKQFEFSPFGILREKFTKKHRYDLMIAYNVIAEKVK
jgi:hypothetical protein